MGADDSIRDATIRDFGAQWTAYRDNDGYYASTAMFRDIVAPLMAPEAFAGKRVIDIGAGTGRIVRMLLAAGAAKVVAVEPSDAAEVLRANTIDVADKVEILRLRGDEIPAEPKADFVLSIGVLHHIADPAPVVAAAFTSLQPGGRMLVWLYGREGNGLYLAIFGPLRAVTRRLPDFFLRGLCHALCALLTTYVALAKFLPVPMRVYCRKVLAKYPYKHLFLTIFDQLNPAYAKYYRRQEAFDLLNAAGFVDIELHHRHGYSWTAVGTKRIGNA